MPFVCNQLSSPDATGLQACVSWIDQVSLIDQIAITKVQMVMLGTPIIGIYGLIIAFALFSNFSKRA